MVAVALCLLYSFVLTFLLTSSSFSPYCSKIAYCKNANFVINKPIVLTPSCEQCDPLVWVVDVLVNDIQLGNVQLHNNL